MNLKSLVIQSHWQKRANKTTQQNLLPFNFATLLFFYTITFVQQYSHIYCKKEKEKNLFIWVYLYDALYACKTDQRIWN